jgi:phasin
MVNATPFEIPAQMRQVADRSVDQARKAFGDFIDATQKAVAASEGSARTAQSGAGEAGRQALAYVEENVKATFDLAARMVQARTIEEMAALQQEYLRRQMEAAAAQGRGIAETFMRTAGEAAKKPSR